MQPPRRIIFRRRNVVDMLAKRYSIYLYLFLLKPATAVYACVCACVCVHACVYAYRRTTEVQALY